MKRACKNSGSVLTILIGFTVTLITIPLIFVTTSAFGITLQDFQVIGSGTVETNCLETLYPGCTITASGTATGPQIVDGAFTLRLDLGSPAFSNGYPAGTPQGVCLPASFRGTLTVSNGDSLYLNHVGMVCEEATGGSPYHFNGTYRITGGTGQFATAAGSGNLTSTFTRDGAAVFLQIHGVIGY